MARGIIGKALRGAAAVAVPAALEQQRAEIMAERDARLEGYASAREQRGYAHDKTMQGERLTAQATESEKDRGLTREGHDIQRESVSLARQQLDINKTGAEMDQQIKAIELDNATTLRSLYDQYKTETDPEKIAEIERRIDVFNNKSNDNYLPVQIKDAMGDYTGDIRIFDKRRGQWVDDKRGGGAAEYSTPEEVRDAYKSGKITRDKAKELIGSMQAL